MHMQKSIAVANVGISVYTLYKRISWPVSLMSKIANMQ